ncbi:hypothetical protein DH2020_017367 [Rehmannia glutinosa]|uniref:DUF4408 domain-containing protein n=1 Tax=Rehmannia glutinosa TaxID=99300 RepID=A0ABR0WQW9_REHGL
MECPIKGEKIQAIKNYKRAQFLYNFILYSLTSLITCLFFSYSFWFPSIKHLILFSLPENINSYFSDPKCLFIVANLIIFILIGESKLLRSSNSSPASDIYDEYIARSRSCPKVKSNVVIPKEKEQEGHKKSMNYEEKTQGNIKNLSVDDKKKELRVCNSMHIHQNKQKKKGLRVSKSEIWDQKEIVKREKIKGEIEDQLYMPKEDLNKRVEDFIARVNKQRLLEAKLVDHSRG